MKDWLKPRTVFAALFYGTFCYLILIGTKVPPELNTIISVLMGYFFGNKTKRLDQTPPTGG